MSVRLHRFLCVFIAGTSLAALSCSSATKGPVAGSPAFNWAAANENFKNGDYQRTASFLAKLSTNPEYGGRAQPWEMIVNAGLAQGYMDLADRYEAGVRASRGVPLFRTKVSQYRSAANAAALQFTESIHGFLNQNKDESVTLAFPYPSGTVTEPGQVTRVAKGVPPNEGDVTSIERAMLQRGILLAIANVAGSPNDPAKARELMKSGELKLPRCDFLRGAARLLYDETALYMPKQLDHPQRMGLLCREAKEALACPKQPTKEDLALRKKIDETVKKYKLSS